MLRKLRKMVSLKIKDLEQIAEDTYKLDNDFLTESIEASIEKLENTLELIERLIREGAE